MSTNDFDRLLAEKINGIPYPYDEADWQAASKQLAAARRKKRAILLAYTLPTGMAAAIAVFFICIIPLISKKEITTPQYTTAPAARSVSLPAVIKDSATEKTQSPDITIQPLAAHLIPANKNMASTALTPANVTTAETPNSYVQAAGTTSVPPAAHDTIITATPHHQDAMPFVFDDGRETQKQERKKVNISVAGGVNYGTLNTGYAVGAVADKKLGNRLALEITVGYINNTTSAPVGGFATGVSASGYYGPPQAKTTSPLNYLQFAPAAAYGITQKLTLAAGADVQRLLQPQEMTVFYNDALRTAPLYDMGLLLKTDYAVSPRIKAGASYRMGVNNYFSNTDYLNRNYFQVQLKFRLN